MIKKNEIITLAIMILGLFGCRPDKNLQVVFLGSGSYTLKISKQYLTERDEKEGTVMIYPKGSECITLRIDVLSFNPKNDSVESTTGYDYVRQNSENKTKKLFFEKDMAIVSYEKNTVENGTNLIMKFWEVGPKDNRIIIISATILERLQNDKRVNKLLASIPEIIRSIEPTETHDSIETSSGAVNYTTTRQEPTDQKITTLNNDDKEFIDKWFKNGWNIILYYKPKIRQTELTIKILDSIFKEWLNDKSKERFSSDSIANGLGVVFGELLSKELKMNWVKVIDEYGEEYGVRNQNSFTSFPISSVRKRIESGESEFFSNIYEMLKHSINSKNE